MHYKASYSDNLGETNIELTSNTYADAWPMLRRIIFRKLPIDLNAQCLPLATAVLTRSYCGDVFEFAGIKIGSDYSEAIRTLLSPQANIVSVDGFNRTFSTGELDVMVSCAGKESPPPTQTSGAPLARIDWSGDFVDPATRSSAGFAFGSVQTNAAFFADPFSVSIAVGLLFGRDRCGHLFVAQPAADRRQYECVREALRIVGVTLHAAVEHDAPLLARAS